MSKYVEIMPDIFLNRDLVVGWNPDTEGTRIQLNSGELKVPLTPQEVLKKLEEK